MRNAMKMLFRSVSFYFPSELKLMAISLSASEKLSSSFCLSCRTQYTEHLRHYHHFWARKTLLIRLFHAKNSSFIKVPESKPSFE